MPKRKAVAKKIAKKQRAAHRAARTARRATSSEPETISDFSDTPRKPPNKRAYVLDEDEEAAHSADGEDVDALLSADEGAPQPSTSNAAVDKKRKRRAKEKERKAKVCVPYLLHFPSLY